MADVTSIQKELENIKESLIKLKGKAKAPEDLTPFQDRLLKIDGMRKDGKFIDAKGEVPPGQAMLHDLLAECYDTKDAILDSL